MKKIFSCLLLICIAFSLVSCEKSNSSDTSKNSSQIPTATISDSNKLVWVLSDYSISSEISEPRLVTISENDYDYNEYLNLTTLLKQKGLTTNVEFKRLLVPEPQNEQPPIIEGTLESLIDKGCQIDVISYTNQSLSYLLDLTDYLNTDIGAKVKATISEKVWQGIGNTDGKQYFIPKIKVLQGRQNAYVIDKALMNNSSLTQEDLQMDMEGLTKVFDKVKNEEFSCYSIGASMYSSIVFPSFTPVDNDFVFPFLAIDKRKNNGLIENIYENDKCLSELQMLLNWKDQGIYRSEKEKSLILDSTYQEKNWYGESNIVIPIGDSYAESDIRGKSLAICKTSKYADEAFEVLAMSVINPEISMAVNPYQVNIAADELKLKTFDSFGFYPNFEPVQEEYNKCVQIIRDKMTVKYDVIEKKELPNYGNVWEAKMKDLDAGIKELNDDLKAAGLDKILTEFNSQLTDFYKLKN
mgnify:CR=1 FL=1